MPRGPTCFTTTIEHLATDGTIGHDESMTRYFRKLHTDRSPPGLERVIWRRLPLAFLGSVLIPISFSVGTRLFPPDGSDRVIAKTTAMVDICAFAAGLTAVTAVVTVAIGCIVVMIMKGPGYVADGYALDAADKPAPEREQDAQ